MSDWAHLRSGPNAWQRLARTSMPVVAGVLVAVWIVGVVTAAVYALT